MQVMGGQEGFLIAKHTLARVAADRFRDTTRQWADAGVGEKDFLASDRKFLLAEFFIGEQFRKCHD